MAAIFSAVDKGRTDILRLIISHGADPNARHSHSGIPVLASAIFQNNASAVVSLTILLESGADPFVIPRDLWDDGTSSIDARRLQDAQSKTRWCDEANGNLLTKCFNLAIKHCLNEAAKRYYVDRDGAKVDSFVNVEFSNHLLMGQRVALNRINEYLRCHWLCGKREPLILAFVGPAGHGKTELARRIGSIHPLGSISAVYSQTSPSITDEEEDFANARNNRLLRPADDVNVTWIDGSEDMNSSLLTSVLNDEGKGKSCHKDSQDTANSPNLLIQAKAVVLKRSLSSVLLRRITPLIFTIT